MKQSERAHDRAETARMTKTPDYFCGHDEKNVNSREWDALKAWQKQQREQFFSTAKTAFRAVRNAAFREVRVEFSRQWDAYYAAMRSGQNRASLAETKVALIAAQNRALDERRIATCDALREQRDLAYGRHPGPATRLIATNSGSDKRKACEPTNCSTRSIQHPSRRRRAARANRLGRPSNPIRPDAKGRENFFSRGAGRE